MQARIQLDFASFLARRGHPERARKLEEEAEAIRDETGCRL
jgi:hypothetical protein